MLVKHSPPLPRRNKKHTERVPSKSPSLEEILEDVCRCFIQSVESIKSPRQYNRYIIPRRIYCYVSHVLTNESCGNAAALINRDHSTYIDRLAQCFEWFEINEPSFIDDWNVYTSRSEIWKEYYLLKKQALIDGCSKHIEELRKQEHYWKRQVKQAKEQKRKWEEQIEKATELDIEVVKSKVKIYKNRLSQGKRSLSFLRSQYYK
jgi:hypothetical protein